jgi:hypothetical protein
MVTQPAPEKRLQRGEVEIDDEKNVECSEMKDISFFVQGNKPLSRFGPCRNTDTSRIECQLWKPGLYVRIWARYLRSHPPIVRRDSREVTDHG